MGNNTDNIELRSDKVRSIIGQIPPWIVRSGISVIFLVIVVLMVGSYYFKYPYIITTTVEFSKKDNSFVGVVRIPANEISKIHKGQTVEIMFDNVKNMNNTTFSSKLKAVSTKLTISENIGYYKAVIDKIDGIELTKTTKGIAIIKTEEISFLDRILKPINNILTKNRKNKRVNIPN